MYEKQMELFEDGGLRDEGGMVDEQSGNDVPVGSTCKEVRDDIPAMLSEGEFVFPADVVRYIGLEKLMRMRQEAKMGLKMMEEMGQMGNADEATIPDDIPFSVIDIQIAEGDDDDEVRPPQRRAVPWSSVRRSERCRCGDGAVHHFVGAPPFRRHPVAATANQVYAGCCGGYLVPAPAPCRAP